MKVVNLNDVSKKIVAMDGALNVEKQIPISKDDGTPNMSLRVFTVNPGGHTPYHQHDYEQLNYVVEGDGVLINENSDELPLTKGDFALVLPNEKHQYKNISSDKQFIFLCGVPKEFE